MTWPEVFVDTLRVPENLRGTDARLMIRLAAIRRAIA